MAAPELRYLVFASRDSAHYPQAQLLAHELQGQLVDRLSSVLPDLLLVARYRILEPVAVVVLRDDRLVARYPRLVTREQILRDLAGIT